MKVGISSLFLELINGNFKGINCMIKVSSGPQKWQKAHSLSRIWTLSSKRRGGGHTQGGSSQKEGWCASRVSKR